MTVINSSQGAPKASEIASDEALSNIGTLVNEDTFTVLKQIYQLALDGNRSFSAFSNGRIRWSGTTIEFDADSRQNDIHFRLLGLDSATIRTCDLIMQGTNIVSANTFGSMPLANGDLIYVELKRSFIDASGGTIILENAVNGGSLVIGKTVRKVNLTSSTGLPKLSIDLSGNSDTLNIPIAFRYDWTTIAITNEDLMWVCNGARWKKETTVELGAATAISSGGAILNFLETSAKPWDGEIDASGWVEYNDSSAFPVDGIGGVVNAGLTFGITNIPVEILSGLGSFVFNKVPTTNLLGHGVAVDFKIYKGYRGRRNTIRFIYEFLSGFVSGEIGCFIIADPGVTNVLITPFNNTLIGVKGEAVMPFDPIDSIENYRLCFHVITNEVTPFRLTLDDVKINPIYFATSDAIASPALAGFISNYGGTSDLDGWAICDGREYPRATYPELFANIGTAYGTRNASVFNIPDLRGLFVRGLAPDINYNFVPSAVNISTEIITIASNKINRSGLKVRLTSSGGLPSPLAINTDYFTIFVDGNSFKLALSLSNALSGTAINLTTQGTGTHTIVQWVDPDALTRYAEMSGANIGNAIGSMEDDSFRSHNHTMSPVSAGALGYSPGPYGTFTFGGGATNVSGGSETRPANTTTNYLIKLYNDKKNTVLISSLVEYASNADATATASELVSFSHAITGQFIPAIPLLTIGTRRIQFTAPISVSDRIFIETDMGSNGVIWTDAAQIFPFTKSISTSYGMSISPVISFPNEVDITFASGGATGDGAAWSTVSTWRWRVVKTANPNAVEVSVAELTGVIKEWAGDISPQGYLLCDGRSLLRSAYANLFGVVGIKYGAMDGTTFNIPDKRGIFSRGFVGVCGGAITAVSTLSNTLSIINHNLNRTGFPIIFSGPLPTGLTAGVVYYAIVVDSNTISVATTQSFALAGTKIVLTTTTTGGVCDQALDLDAATRLASSIGGNSGSNLGSYEDDQFKSHAHLWGNVTATNINNGPNTSLAAAGGSSYSTFATGGTETRPKNTYTNYIIKY